MRKILFRAKTVFDQRWVFGDCRVTAIMQQINWLKYKKYSVEIMDKDFKVYIVDSETLSQFIGLSDKNNKMIFEGDVIKWRKHIFVVEFYTDDFQAVFYPFCCADDFFDIKASECEIIGNVYDNPELKEKCE